jgi:hypothetical protein
MWSLRKILPGDGNILYVLSGGGHYSSDSIECP